MIGTYYENKRKMSFGMALILIFLIIIIIILIRVVQKLENENFNKNIQAELTGTDTVQVEFNLQDLVKNASYSVVGVSKLNQKNTSVFVENSEEKLGMGSGIILTSNGFILSNYETTGGLNETCFVSMKNGTIYPAEVKWVDINLDVSIIKISAENLLNLAMGDSNNIEIGEKFYVLSNPTGYDFNENLNELIITKKKDTLKIVNENNTVYVEDIIKTNLNIDLSMNGGAVLKESGEVFGIVSNKVNAIIPINRIKNIINRLSENENYKEPYIGIYGFDNDTLKYLKPDYPLKLGIYVDRVEENSSLSGQVFIGDIITKIDDYELSNYQELNEYLYTKNINDKIVLTIIRGTKEMKIESVLKENPPSVVRRGWQGLVGENRPCSDYYRHNDHYNHNHLYQCTQLSPCPGDEPGQNEAEYDADRKSRVAPAFTDTEHRDREQGAQHDAGYHARDAACAVIGHPDKGPVRCNGRYTDVSE